MCRDSKMWYLQDCLNRSQQDKSEWSWRTRDRIKNEIHSNGYKIVEYKGKFYLMQPATIRKPSIRTKKDPEQVEIKNRLLAEIASAKNEAPDNSSYLDEYGNHCKFNVDPHEIIFRANGSEFSIKNSRQSLEQFENIIRNQFPVTVNP